MHSAIRHVAERALRVTGIAAMGRRRRRGDALILAYHNVLPFGEEPRGDASLHMPLRDFRRQMDALMETHEVVPLDSAMALSEPDGPSRVAITFDDAYAGAVAVGVPELVSRGLPATIFAAPGLLGRYTWWDTLSRPGGGLPADLRDRALAEFQGDGDAILEWVGRRGEITLGASFRIATENELADALVHPGLAVGSHTWSHANLAALDRLRIDREIADSMAWLRERFPRTIPWLSYPYGSFTPDAERAAADANLAGAVRVDGGWIPSSTRPPTYAVPRFNVPAGISLDGFLLRLSGLGA